MYIQQHTAYINKPDYFGRYKSNTTQEGEVGGTHFIYSIFIYPYAPAHAGTHARTHARIHMTVSLLLSESTKRRISSWDGVLEYALMHVLDYET